uniref:Zinc finger CCCH domain-containing protein 7B-like n=1 Tax=Sinocyclocheilus grahami TaxID=75366 RepID=A0A672Q7Y4_SINGR
MDLERQKRKEEIQKALGFIQSSLPFPEPEGYEAFLTQLVCNLLDEGNSVYRDGEWRQAALHYSEGVNVARYAQSEALVIPPELLESLYVNRAAAHYSLGEFERGVQDCDSALCVSEGSRRALYRKALCLRELGRLREAYECGTGCLLTAPHVCFYLPNEWHINLQFVLLFIPFKSLKSEFKIFFFINLLNTGVINIKVLIFLSIHQNPVQGAIPTNLPNTAVGLRPPYSPGLPASSAQLMTPYFNSAVSPLCPLESSSVLGQSEASSQTMDSLGSFSSGARDTAGKGGSGSLSTGGLDSLSEYTLPGECFNLECDSLWSFNGPVVTNLSLLSRNPLAATHEFRQACNACYSRIGPRVMDYYYQPDAAHRCKRDVLLCRLKSSDDPTWKRVRPRPARNNFLGAFVLCKEVQERQECQYGENCTFAYCQEEIDVWTQERKGALSRELLFDPLGTNERRALSVTRLLQLHMGMFMFLCEECFDSKPRIISKRSKENLAVCSNLTARHPFDDNKCLVHVVRSANVRYSKVRPLHPLCQFDVCRHEVRYGCQREDSCSFAHSVIELKCWVLQQDTGITHEEMVQESKRHWHRLEQNSQRQKVRLSNNTVSAVVSGGVVSGGGDGIGGGSTGGGGGGLVGCGRGRGLNLKMKFVCGQCWREGQVNEPDKSLKYCTAKARHSWTKERRVLLVKSFEKKKWVVVRPLPFSRTYPQQYDMCVHVMKQKKCHYIGNCSFAHSLEERDVWTYMKNNSLRDMQQMYEMWLSLTNQNRRADDTLMTPPPEEKQIAMPTDYSESMVGGCRRKLFGLKIHVVLLLLYIFFSLIEGLVIGRCFRVCSFKLIDWDLKCIICDTHKHAIKRLLFATVQRGPVAH